MEIYDTNNTFDFEKVQLTKPTISNGSYFIKFLVQGNPLYIQPPKCKTRQGIIKSGKRLYCDLMFTNDNEDFIQWMENLENYCQQTIYKNRDKWFDGDMDLHDIENYFTSTLKIFKSGKFYIVRTNISTVLGKPILKIYDENENEVSFETITDEMNIMTILEIQGIKCSSKSFQIEIEMKQLMVLRPTNIFEKCIIKGGTNGSPSPPPSSSISDPPLHPPSSSEGNNSDFVSTSNEMSETIVQEQCIEPFDTELDDKNIDETQNKDNKTDGLEKKCSENIESQNNNIDGLEEIDFPLEEFKDEEPMLIKKRNNIYYEMYKEAKRKARIARDLALSAYLEAKRIKNTYMLDEIDDDEDNESNSSDSDDSEENSENEKDEENE